MYLTLIKNSDESKIVLYKIARIIYAETNASSLRAAEALASMISNLRAKSKRRLIDIADDRSVFESLDRNSSRHEKLLVGIDSNGFQMCLRVARRMIGGGLSDECWGATKFHRAEFLPDWAVARGYIAEIDGLYFYL
ncbi:MAG: hypothetical protein LBD50_02650 [Rickettsiales bacterium]|nr:hypothetical protein [Rickettsiales bacterium]